MKRFGYILLVFVLSGCLHPPPPWVPSGDWAGEDLAESVTPVHPDLEGDLELLELLDQTGDKDRQEIGDLSTKDTDLLAEVLDLDFIEQCASDNEFAVDAPEVDFEAYHDTEDVSTPDVPVCPPGYVWSEAQGKCVSFCAADQYYETKLGKCVYYPCCDLSGDWNLNVLDSETMLYTIYQVKINQLTSYLEGEAKSVSPPEQAECYGLLEDKKFTLNCVSGEYTLVLTSGTTMSSSVSGFYSYQYTDGNFKNGSFNMKKSN